MRPWGGLQGPTMGGWVSSQPTPCRSWVGGRSLPRHSRAPSSRPLHGVCSALLSTQQARVKRTVRVNRTRTERANTGLGEVLRADRVPQNSRVEALAPEASEGGRT